MIFQKVIGRIRRAILGSLRRISRTKEVDIIRSGVIREVDRDELQLRLRVAGNGRALREKLKQVMLNDVWTIGGRGVRLIVTPATNGYDEVCIYYHSIGRRTNGTLLDKLRSMDEVIEVDWADGH